MLIVILTEFDAIVKRITLATNPVPIYNKNIFAYID
jgi:hypothetical protein